MKGDNIINQIKSKKRVADHGEVFTSEREVNAMLDLVKQETERIESRFLEPACGTGNFLFEILHRKFDVVKKRYAKSLEDYSKYMIVSLSSIYGVELLEDNVIDCRKRMYHYFLDTFKAVQKTEPSEQIKRSAEFILNRNILHGDALTLLTDAGEPIIFSEWSLVNSDHFKRRDFKLAEMLSFPPMEKKNLDLPSEYYMDDLFSDTAKDNLTIRVYKEYPLVPFWRVYEHD